MGSVEVACCLRGLGHRCAFFSQQNAARSRRPMRQETAANQDLTQQELRGELAMERGSSGKGDTATVTTQ
eukprot:3470680-Rhodomonas_salina.1